MLPAYAELHCLSNFSFLRGASHPEELVERAHAQGYTALAITDECSLCGVVRAHLAAKACGLKLVIGSELTLADGVKLVLLAPDRASYGNLAQLITRGRRSAAKGRYTLTRADVAAHADGLLALWVPPDDPASAAALATARWVATTFVGPRLDRGRARHSRRRPHAAPGARRLVAGERIAASGGRRRPHACPRPPRAAGHADGGPPARPARRMRPRALSQRRAAPALAGAPRHDLSAGIAGRDGRHRRSLHVFAGRAALRISGGNRAAGRDAGIASAPSGRGRITAAIPR